MQFYFENRKSLDGTAFYLVRPDWDDELYDLSDKLITVPDLS